MMHKEYSLFVAVCLIILSIYNLFYLFLLSNKFWLVLGVAIFNSINILITGKSIFNKLHFSFPCHKVLSNILKNVNAAIIFFSATYSYIRILEHLKIFSEAFYLTPIIIVILLLLSSSIGLHND